MTLVSRFVAVGSLLLLILMSGGQGRALWAAESAAARLLSSLQVWEDPTGQASFQEAHQAWQQGAFQALPEAQLVDVSGTSAWWLSLDGTLLPSDAGTLGAWFLEVQIPLLLEADLYWREAGQLQQLPAGLLRPPGPFRGLSLYPLLELPPHPDPAQPLLLRLHNDPLPLIAWVDVLPPEALFVNQLFQELLIGVFYTLLFLMLLMQGVLAWRGREGALHATYAVELLAHAGFFLYYNGFPFLIHWDSLHPGALLVFVNGLPLVLSIEVMKRALQLPHTWPQASRLITYTQVFTLVSSVAFWSGFEVWAPHFPEELLILPLQLVTVGVLGACWWRFHRTHSEVTLLTLAWSLPLLASVYIVVSISVPALSVGYFVLPLQGAVLVELLLINWVLVRRTWEHSLFKNEGKWRERLRQEARGADELHEQVTGHLAEQVIPPLQSVNTLLQSVKEGNWDLPQTVASRVRLAQEASLRLIEQMERVFQHAQAQEKALPCHPQPLQLRALLEDLLRVLEPRSRHLLVLDAPESLPTVWADPHQVYQLLQELTLNALQHSVAGEVLLEAWLEGERVQIGVQDGGPVPTATEFQQWLQPGKRHSRARPEATAGLSLAQELARLHQSELRCEGTPGGKRIGFSLMSLAASSREVAPPEPLPTPRFRVFLVDEDQMLLWSGLEAFQRAQVQVDGFGSGAELLQQLERFPDQHPDAILMATQLPGMDGFTLCQHVRKLERFSQLPILLLTSFHREREVTRVFESGANDYVSKPIHFPELIARLEPHLLRETPPEIRPERPKVPETGRPPRQELVKVTQEVLQAWEAEGGSKVAFAQQFGWGAHQDGTVWRTRGLDRYLDLASLPANPRVRKTVSSLQAALEALPESPTHMQLQNRLDALSLLFQEQGATPFRTAD